MPLKDLAIWLGKCAGVTLTHAAKIEEHTVALPNLGNAYMRQPRLKDCLNHRKRQLIASTKLDSELSVIAPTHQPSATTSSAITPPPCDKEGGSTEMRPTPAPYSDGDILMGNIDDSVTNDLYQ